MSYVAGADLMLKVKIWIRFVEYPENMRRPVSHTCGCVLDLAFDYKSFLEFRTEFKCVLESNVCVMDFV